MLAHTEAKGSNASHSNVSVMAKFFLCSIFMGVVVVGCCSIGKEYVDPEDC